MKIFFLETRRTVYYLLNLAFLSSFIFISITNPGDKVTTSTETYTKQNNGSIRLHAEFVAENFKQSGFKPQESSLKPSISIFKQEESSVPASFLEENPLVTRLIPSDRKLTSLTLAGTSWSSDPTQNTPVSTASYNQKSPQIAPDGYGGAIVSWVDLRNDSINEEIYAQRISASGTLVWSSSGIPIYTAAVNSLSYPKISLQTISDSSGGSIITWHDHPNDGNWSLRAQRLNASGVAQWTANGVLVASGVPEKNYPQIISDGSGGAIITWQDSRNYVNGGLTWSIYAQRISVAGTPLWTANGVLISGNIDGTDPHLIPDESGGAIIAWDAWNSDTGMDIYAQRINASGTIQWTANGIVISRAASGQYDSQIISDGSGGAIISWTDERNGNSNKDVYAQRINSSGVPQWTNNGVPVSTAANNQLFANIASDSSGGAIITWHDDRSGDFDVYAQRISSSGIPSWTINGIPVSIAAGVQSFPQVSYYYAGGAVITWSDNRNGNYDIYAQRVNASGISQWTANGIPISTAANSQSAHQMAHDGLNGAIIAWSDRRNGSTNLDIYAQRLNSLGILGEGQPVDNTPPSLPLQIAPVDLAITDTMPKFRWSSVSDTSPPVLYDLRVASASSMAVPTISKINLATNTYTLTGAESLASGTWYWQVRARDSTSTPWNYSSWSSPAWSFSVQSTIIATATWQAGWIMWSYPFVPDTSTNSNQLSDDVAPLFVYHYNASTGVYDITTVATPGWGYWTKLSGSTPVDMSGQPVASATFDIALGSSWNQIGSPYNATIAWSSVQFIKDGVTKSLADASAAGWVSQWIYNYDTTGGVYQTKGSSDGILAPMVGYWMKASMPNVTLRITRP